MLSFFLVAAFFQVILGVRISPRTAIPTFLHIDATTSSAVCHPVRSERFAACHLLLLELLREQLAASPLCTHHAANPGSLRVDLDTTSFLAPCLFCETET